MQTIINFFNGDDTYGFVTRIEDGDDDLVLIGTFRNDKAVEPARSS